jgi:hypothetical protein
VNGTWAHCSAPFTGRAGKRFCSKRCRDASRWNGTRRHRGPRAPRRRNGTVVSETEHVRLVAYAKPIRGRRPVMSKPTPGARVFFYFEHR